jgi:hypothetical protein
MNNDQRAHRIAITIFAAALTVVITAALVTTIESVETTR